MRDRVRFAKLMLALSLGLKMYGRDFSTEFQEVYWTALGDLSDDEFERAATVLLRREVDFPAPALFLEIARPRLNANADAHRVMCQALLLSDYDPEGGTTWRASRIKEEISVAAYEAFLACGGAPGFRDYDSPFHGARIRREFCEAYTEALEADPSKMLPAPSTKALPSPELEALTAGIGREIPKLARPAWSQADSLPVRVAKVLSEEEIEAKRAGFRELAQQAKAKKSTESPQPTGVA